MKGVDKQPHLCYNTSTVKEVVKLIDPRPPPASPILIIIIIIIDLFIIYYKGSSGNRSFLKERFLRQVFFSEVLFVAAGIRLKKQICGSSVQTAY